MPINFSSARFLDRLEQILAAALLLWFIARLWPAEWSSAAAYPILLIFSETIVVIFILARRPTDKISLKFGDWLLAASGTFLSLLVVPGGAPLIPPFIGVALLLCGIFVHTAAKLSLRRSFGLVAANRGVKTSGMYVFVRHPMYAGYILTHIAYLLLSPSWWNLAIYLTVWALLVGRIFAEERILSEDQAYTALQSRVPYRLVPGVF